MPTRIGETQSVPSYKADPTKKSDTVIDIELKKADEMLKDSKCDYKNILNQIFKISILLHRLGAVESKIYALDKDQELAAQIKKIRSTYNGWWVMGATMLSGGAQIAGGVLSVIGAVQPQRYADEKNKTGPLPNRLLETGKSISNLGQGISPIVSLLNSRAEGNRAVLQFQQQVAQRRQEDRNRSYSEDSQLTREALRKMEQADSELHQAISRMVDTRS